MKRMFFFLITQVMIVPAAVAQAPNAPVVHVSNYPLAYFAERIAGSLIEVRFAAPADVDPAFWRPSESTLLELQQADLILLNGAGYERWATAVSLPSSRVVDTTRALSERLIRTEEVVTHTHGPTGEHSHEDLAFTTWLDLQIAGAQAAAIAAVLIRRWPEKQDRINGEFEQLMSDLGSLDAEFLAIGSALSGQPLLASHPVYQYFARRYGLRVESLHWEPEAMPGATQWQELEVLLANHPARWMLWEAPPAAEIRARLSELGVMPVVIYPLGNRPAHGDFLTAMHANAAALRAAIEPRNYD